MTEKHLCLLVCVGVGPPPQPNLKKYVRRVTLQDITVYCNIFMEIITTPLRTVECGLYLYV